MNYPLISEYIEATRSAEDNFDKLSNLRPVLDANGNPVMSSGNFAVVFKMKDIETGKMYAVKCFTREQEEREERYREIIKVLEHVKSPYFVSTQYYDKELFVDTSQDAETEYPVLVMDWVEGTCLDEYILTIKDDKAKRELLSNKFQEFVSWLLPKHFAHGDIKPDNIVVKDDGNVMLVDYDGMFVPSLYGKPALEFGTPMFRYKNRTLEDFNEYIDDYATVFILLVLKVSVTYPTIIDDFVNREPQFDIVKRIVTFMNDKQIAPIISAYIMVANYGHLDRQLIPSLIANRANFNLSKENNCLIKENEMLIDPTQQPGKLVFVGLLYSARQGNTRDMIELAELYEKGESVAKNIDKAMKWYNLALNLGDANAACSLCFRLRNDPDELFNDNDVLFEKLYQSGCNFAYCRKGECSNSKEDLQLAADRGFAPALYNMGKRYEFLCEEKDKNKAIEYYTKAAEQGYTVAMHALRRLYKENTVESIKWLKKLAYYGNTKEQCELGLEYYKGIIINKDISEAIYWLDKAAIKGDETAMFYLGEIYDQVEDYQDICKAVYWYRKAAEAGDSDAQYNLAICYEHGDGVEKDFSKAVYWWKKAAANESFEAMRALAICHFNGWGVECSIDIANYWLRKVATLQKGGLTMSHILKEYRFVETFTIEQFGKTYNNSKLIMKSSDDGMIVLECGSAIVQIVDNTIPEHPLISCICHRDNENENGIWILHEEGVCAPILVDF